MNPLIVYQSRTGNTRIIVDAIAQILNADVCLVGDVTSADLKDRKLVGFGSGIYWVKIDRKIYETASHLPHDCNVFMFISSGLDFPVMLQVYWYLIKKRFDRLGLRLVGKWDCRGYDKHFLSRWMGISKKHPNSADIVNVREFAQKMKKYE